VTIDDLFELIPKPEDTADARESSGDVASAGYATVAGVSERYADYREYLEKKYDVEVTTQYLQKALS
jgi:hypothetical protein